MIARLILVAAAVVLAGCGTAANIPPPAAPPSTHGTPGGLAAPASAAPAPAAAPGELPDHALTPGAAGENLTEICPHVAAALEAARPSTAVKARVFAEYGIPRSRWHLFRIDHLIALGIDGRNTLANLWPQPYAASLRKDRVEDALHAAVCSGQVPLRAAQTAMAADWLTAEQALGVAS